MNTMSRRLAGAVTAVLLGAPFIAAAPAQAADEVTLNLIGINDFHGRIDANTVKFAGTVEQVRQSGGDANSLLISAGDNVSASLFASAVQDDIPTIDVLNALHLDASAAGNHEFDKGAADLTGRLSDAADFPFLAANVFKADSSPLLDSYEIFTIDGVDVAVVGAVTQETPSLVTPAGIEGLTLHRSHRIDQRHRRRARGAGRSAGRHRRVDPRGRARRHQDARPERRRQPGLQEDRRADRSRGRRDLHGSHAPGLRVRRTDPGRARQDASRAPDGQLRQQRRQHQADVRQGHR